jgi:hypothetical protein
MSVGLGTSVERGLIAALSANAPRTVDLSDGTVGYFVRAPRVDDCWAAAVATCVQVPIDEVPDSRIDERLRAGEHPDEISRSAWEEFGPWLAERGLRMLVHRKVPARSKRWIGIIPMPGILGDHCILMSGAQALFDPTQDFVLPRLMAVAKALGRPAPKIRTRRFGADAVRWGFSFQKMR